MFIIPTRLHRLCFLAQAAPASPKLTPSGPAACIARARKLPAGSLWRLDTRPGRLPSVWEPILAVQPAKSRRP